VLAHTRAWDLEGRVQDRCVEALLQLENGEPIGTVDWQRIIKLVPSKQDGEELLVRGTKSRFAPRRSHPSSGGVMSFLPGVPRQA